MAFDRWLAFVVASAILLAVPGPTMLLVISCALGHGRKAAAAVVAGVALGDLTAMSASMLGLGAILATSAAIFTLLRGIGGAYLIYLGWRAPVQAADADDLPRANSAHMLGHAYAVTALNPRGIVFFVAFVPQFLNATRPLVPRVVTLVATFVTLAAVNATIYALLATAARQRLRQPRVRRLVNRTGGSLLLGAGILAAGWRKAAA